MNYLEAIVELKNIVDPNFIKRIISLIDKKAKNPLPISNQVDKEVRNVKGYSLNFDTPTNLFYWNYIKTEIERLFVLYKSKFPMINATKIHQIDLLKYTSGGKYNIHIDYARELPRNLSVIINLNGDYEGGELSFTDQTGKEIKSLKLNKGSVVFFPSNFLYPHLIKPIKKGKRYSIAAWLQ